MEEIPRMPMLSVEVKYSASSTDFGPKISECILKSYEESPSNYSKEICELNALREGACKAGSDFVGCNLLKKYYAQLNLLKNRFSMESSSGEASVTFSWFEKYSDMSNATSLDDIRYEMACILHNVGALHSYLGAVDSRLDADGMKISCTHFQRAAYAFHHLNESPGVSLFCNDFDPAILNWNINLMMAQAQECILEKSIVDSRNPNIIAKIAMQLSTMYKKCLDSLDNQSVSEIVEEFRSKLWKKFIRIKQKYYTAIAYLHSGVAKDCLDVKQAAVAENIGERIAYLQGAKEHLAEALKLASKESLQIKQPLLTLEAFLDHLYTAAKKENDFIYHEKILSFGDLPEIKGVSLVKLIPFDPLDPEISGPDIFGRLMPLSVHQSASLYSEEKARLLREYGEKIQLKDELLDQYLLSLQLEDVSLRLGETSEEKKLPEKLLECCAAFNAVPDAVPELLSSMNRLSTLYGEVESVLLDFDQQLEDAESELIKCETLAPLEPDVKEAQSRVASLRKEYKSYLDANQCATKNNAELHEALVAHSDNLKILSLPLSEVRKRLPCSLVAGGPEKADLTRLLAKVEEMRAQRKSLLDELRQMLNDDDITKLLLANKDSDTAEIFAKQIAKHDEFLKVINQNLAAQDNIIEALTEANAKCAPVRKATGEALKRRDAFVERLMDSYTVYLNLMEKSKQGITFYDRLQTSLEQFNRRMVEYANFFNRVEEKVELAQKKAQKSTTFSTASANQNVDGPKLKDYLAYYQGRKASQQNRVSATSQQPASQFAPPHATVGQRDFSSSTAYSPPLASTFPAQHPTGFPGQPPSFSSPPHNLPPNVGPFSPPIRVDQSQPQRVDCAPPTSNDHCSQPGPYYYVAPASRSVHRQAGCGLADQNVPAATAGYAPCARFVPTWAPQQPPGGFPAPSAAPSGPTFAPMLRENFMDQPIPVPLPPPMAPSANQNP